MVLAREHAAAIEDTAVAHRPTVNGEQATPQAAGPTTGTRTVPTAWCWVHGPWLDAAVALCWIPFVLVTRVVLGTPALAVFVTGVFLLSFAHQPLTVALVYGDPEQFRLRRTLFVVSPFVLAAAVYVGFSVNLVLLAVVGGLWNAEHTLMQRYGITRIYGRKVGEQDGRLEKVLLFSWLTLALLWVAADNRTPERLTTIDLGANNARAVESLVLLRDVAGLLVVPVAVLAAVCMIAWTGREVRNRRRANRAKWLYVGSTAALFAWILVDPVAGIMGYVGAHALEYFVIVHQSMGRRYGDPATGGRSLLARAVRAPTGRVGFFAVYLGAVVALVALLQRFGSPLAYTVVFFTLGGLHIFYDGFIWKLRRPHVARSLALPGAAPPAPG